MRKSLLLIVPLSFILTVSTFGQDPLLRWAKQIGSSNADGATSSVVDVNGNVYTTGSFTYTIDADPGPGECWLSSYGGYDVFISKLDASGSFVWAKQLSGTSFEVGYSIAVDASGNVYTTGTFEGTVDFNPSSGTFSMTAEGGEDIFISKLNASGGFVWAKKFSGTQYEGSNGIAVDGSGNIYITGYFEGAVDFDPGPSSSTLISVSNSSDIFISKLNSGGDYVWVRQIGSNMDEFAKSITVDNSGNVYTTGEFEGTVNFNPSSGTFNLTSNGNYDVFISKLNSSGGFVWAAHLGGSSWDCGESIAVDGSGNVHSTGFFDGTADFDPGTGTYNLTSAGGNEIFISKLNASGNFVWAKGMGGSSNSEAGYGVALDPSGNVYSTGMFEGTADFDPGSATYNLISAGDADIFVSKLDASGNFGWAKRMGGPASDEGKAIALMNSYYIYTSGSFNGTADFDPGSGTYYLTSYGSSDIFIHQLSQCSTPVPPTNTTPPANQNICFSASTLLSVSGTGILEWYNAATGGNLLGTGNYFDTGSLYASITYYVQDSACEASTRTAIPVTVNSKVTATIASQSNVSCNGANDGSVSLTVSGGTPPYTYSWSPGGSTSPTITGLAPGNYTCNITDAMGCTGIIHVTITEPPVIFATQYITLCFGESITIGSNTYASTGIYIDVLTTPNGCDSTLTTHLTVNSEIDVTTAYLSGVTLTANQTGATYQWIDCNNGFLPINGQTNKTFTATTNGDYAVIVTISPCSDTSECVTVNSVGMDEPKQDEFIGIHPNPNNGIFSIQLSVATDITISNAIGELILTEQFEAGIQKIDLSKKPKGIYFVKAQQGNEFRSYRLIIRR
jgi:hypothetical protein